MIQQLIAEVYKEKGNTPWRYTRQEKNTSNIGQTFIERLTTKHRTLDVAYTIASEDLREGKIHKLYLYHPWSNLKGIMTYDSINEYEYKKV